MNPEDAFRAIFDMPDDAPAPVGAQLLAVRRQLHGKVEALAAARGVRLEQRTITVCRRCMRRWPARARALAPLLPTLLAWRAPSYRLVWNDDCATCAARTKRTTRTPAGAD